VFTFAKGASSSLPIIDRSCRSSDSKTWVVTAVSLLYIKVPELSKLPRSATYILIVRKNISILNAQAMLASRVSNCEDRIESSRSSIAVERSSSLVELFEAVVSSCVKESFHASLHSCKCKMLKKLLVRNAQVWFLICFLTRTVSPYRDFIGVGLPVLFNNTISTIERHDREECSILYLVSSSQVL